MNCSKDRVVSFYMMRTFVINDLILCCSGSFGYIVAINTQNFDLDPGSLKLTQNIKFVSEICLNFVRI